MQLCADGYEVTNLVSADPALRRRGFKLEYFLRPPVQVRLCFGTPYLHIHSFRYYLWLLVRKAQRPVQTNVVTAKETLLVLSVISNFLWNLGKCVCQFSIFIQMIMNRYI